MSAPDVIVVGAGSAGCAAVARLAAAGLRVEVLEAGPSDAHPLVKMPFGLVWLMGSGRDWRYRSVPQAGLGGRAVGVPRGRMVGGSGSINSMVWFRGVRADYDGWGLAEWSADAVWTAFEAVEDAVRPGALPSPHPLSAALGTMFGANGAGVPVPERESAGPFVVNMERGARRSAADAFLRPAMAGGRVRVRTGAQVDRLILEDGRAVGVRLVDGTELRAGGGVVLSAGAVASPAVLMRSGIGPGAALRDLGIEVVRDAKGVGANLHDHPAVAVHHAGAGSGYGLEPAQLAAWAVSPLQWLLTRRGRFTSNTVEAGAFLRIDDDAPGPQAQVHFLPAKLGWEGRAITWGAGYYADICLMQPKSRGVFRLASRDGRVAPEIDLGLFSDPGDMALMVRAFRRLRRLLAEAPFGSRAALEAFPGAAVGSDAEIEAHIRARAGTAYHPVGTVALGGPLEACGAVRGVEGLWVADASVMPRITSANTNAPSMMIGHRIGGWVADALRRRPETGHRVSE